MRSIATQGEEMQYTVDFQQSGGTETKTGVVISADELVEVGGGSADAHAVLRWGGKTQSTITMVPLKGVTRDVTAEDSGQMVALAALECRDPPRLCPPPQPLAPGPWPGPAAGWILMRCRRRWMRADRVERWYGCHHQPAAAHLAWLALTVASCCRRWIHGCGKQRPGATSPHPPPPPTPATPFPAPRVKTRPTAGVRGRGPVGRLVRRGRGVGGADHGVGDQHRGGADDGEAGGRGGRWEEEEKEEVAWVARRACCQLLANSTPVCSHGRGAT